MFSRVFWTVFSRSPSLCVSLSHTHTLAYISEKRKYQVFKEKEVRKCCTFKVVLGLFFRTIIRKVASVHRDSRVMESTIVKVQPCLCSPCLTF